MPTHENPFAPPQTAMESLVVEATKGDPPQRARAWSVSLAMWAFVCIASAAPSFFWGMGTIAGKQVLAMCLGIAIFIALYTVADQWTQQAPWRRPWAVRLTLKIGYATRILISVVFPIGAGLDLFCGLFSVGLVEWLLPEPVFQGSNDNSGGMNQASFAVALAVTLVQGVVLNFVLFSYMLLVFAIVWSIKRWRE